MDNFWAELAGTMVLVILGDSVCANVGLAKTKGNGSGWIVVATGWGLAVAIAVYCVNRISGAHINPAVTIAMASIDSLEWAKVPFYLAGQMAGAFLGAVVVWIAFYSHWAETDDEDAILGTFATGPAIRATLPNFLCEVIGTAMLLFGILAIAANAGEIQESGTVDLSAVYSAGINPLLVGFLVFVIGLGLGGPTGYAINPARDLGPRIAHAVLPIPGKGPSDWGYAWIPVAGPIVGGVLGAMLFKFGAEYLI